MQPSKKPISYAFCGFCSIDISIETDVTQVQLNEKSKKHCSSLKSISSRSTFLSTAGFLLINAGSKRKILSIEDQVAKAEIFGAWTLFLGNKTKRWISKRVLMKTARQVFRKTNISCPLIHTLTYMELGQKHEKELAVELEKKNKKRKVLLEKKELKPCLLLLHGEDVYC